MPGVGSDEYFALIRNFRRHAFLLLYLFGASPAVCSSFVQGRQHELRTLADGTMYMPHGTSLRMGKLGYQSEAQASLAVSYNGLDGYAASLHEALTRPYPAYESIGIMNPGGEYNQLATTLLQIENEFYGPIRPKRVIFPGERPLHALRDRGVEYVEVRLLDLDPFVPIGIKPQTLRFLDVFLLHCLMADSAPDTPAEIAEIGRNQHRTAAFGREPGLTLERRGSDVPLKQWASDLFDAFEPVAAALDRVHGTSDHADAVRSARAMLDTPAMLPSARVLDAVQQEYGNSFIAMTRAQSAQVKAKLLALPFSHAQQTRFELLTQQSLQEQRDIEARDSMPFEAWRQQYVSADRLGLSHTAVAPALAAV
jgi:glutamate--cysteine ligase